MRRSEGLTLLGQAQAGPRGSPSARPRAAPPGHLLGHPALGDLQPLAPELPSPRARPAHWLETASGPSFVRGLGPGFPFPFHVPYPHLMGLGRRCAPHSQPAPPGRVAEGRAQLPGPLVLPRSRGLRARGRRGGGNRRALGSFGGGSGGGASPGGESGGRGLGRRQPASSPFP